MRFERFRAVAWVGGLLAAAAGPAAALDYTVTGTGDPPPAACDVTACPSLRSAVIAANANPGADTITLGAGTYQLSIAGFDDTAMMGDLDVTGDLRIVGAGAATTIVDGGAIDRVFHVRDPNAADTLTAALTLEGLAVRNGSVLNQLGGGIYVAAAEAVPGVAWAKAEGGGSLTLLRVEVRGNSAVHNMVNPEGQPVGGSGGGVAAEGALTVTESLIEANSATANGGGIYVSTAWTMLRSTVRGNTAEGGGGIFDTGSHVSTIEASTISGNTAVGGGGINLRNNVTLVLRNGTVDGNTATDVGAGINSNGIVNLVNSTITGNNSGSDAPNGGAGLNSFANGTFRFWNSMVADNRLGAEVPLVRNCGCTGTVCTGGVQFLTIATSLEDGDSCGFNPAAGDLVNTDPGILPLRLYGGATETRALAPFSEAIDAGTAGSGPNGCPPTDQRGVVRPQDGLGVGPPLRCDIGAVEYDPINDVDLDVSFRDGFEPE
jgi:hypothetical protein